MNRRSILKHLFGGAVATAVSPPIAAVPVHDAAAAASLTNGLDLARLYHRYTEGTKSTSKIEDVVAVSDTLFKYPVFHRTHDTGAPRILSYEHLIHMDQLTKPGSTTLSGLLREKHLHGYVEQHIETLAQYTGAPQYIHTNNMILSTDGAALREFFPRHHTAMTRVAKLVKALSSIINKSMEFTVPPNRQKELDKLHEEAGYVWDTLYKQGTSALDRPKVLVKKIRLQRKILAYVEKYGFLHRTPGRSKTLKQTYISIKQAFLTEMKSRIFDRTKSLLVVLRKQATWSATYRKRRFAAHCKEYAAKHAACDIVTNALMGLERIKADGLYSDRRVIKLLSIIKYLEEEKMVLNDAIDQIPEFDVEVLDDPDLYRAMVVYTIGQRLNAPASSWMLPLWKVGPLSKRMSEILERLAKLAN